MNILLVEPDRQLANLYKAALAKVGHVVRISATAQNAVHQADTQRPDVVILELQLVGHSGIEFLYEFRSYVDWQNIPVVIISNVPPGEFIDNMAILQGALGVVGVHYKPRVSLGKLARIIDDLTPDASTKITAAAAQPELLKT